MYSKLKYWYVIIILSFISVMLWKIDSHITSFEEKLEKATGTVSLQMYESIEHWSDSFNIPKHIAYNVAYKETRYKGPFDFNYEHRLESHAGAVGPMQIITKWAHKFAGRRVSEKELKHNIDLNVMISMKMLHKWYTIYKDWTLATGAYNTGSPIRNEYVIYCSTNKDYTSKWVDFK